MAATEERPTKNLKPAPSAADPAIAAGHLAQGDPNRLGVGYIAGQVHGLDSRGVQIRQGLGDLAGSGFAGMGGWIQPGPAEKDKARREGHQTAGQVGADPRAASRYNDHVSGVQLLRWRIAEDRW